MIAVGEMFFRCNLYSWLVQDELGYKVLHVHDTAAHPMRTTPREAAEAQ